MWHVLFWNWWMRKWLIVQVGSSVQRVGLSSGLSRVWVGGIFFRSSSQKTVHHVDEAMQRVMLLIIIKRCCCFNTTFLRSVRYEAFENEGLCRWNLWFPNSAAQTRVAGSRFFAQVFPRRSHERALYMNVSQLCVGLLGAGSRRSHTVPLAERVYLLCK